MSTLEIGGGVGAKLRAYLEPVAALLARKAQQAVKIAMPRTDVFEGTGPRLGRKSRSSSARRKTGA
jgi:CO/xanthine dehydrogenase Mo-binding subunit